MLVAQPARQECKDDVFKNWFAAHAAMIVHFSPELNAYLNALQAELVAARLPLVDPSSDKNRADPFVVALALMVEERDVADLQRGAKRSCYVVAYEGGRKPGAALAKMSDVCKHYGLAYVQWPRLLELESWSC